MRYWWVNQNQTYRQETGGGYLWSPKRKSNGGRNPFYDAMREVAPGDLVFSFSDTLIKAIGVAQSYCFESPKPPEFANAGPNWEQIGWRVEARWTFLIHQVRPKDHIELLRPHLPDRYSPLRQNGDGLQSVYLTEVPKILADVLGSIIGPEYSSLTIGLGEAGRVDVLTASKPLPVEEWESHLEQQLRTDEGIPETQRTALVQARRGQGLFKSRVCTFEQACRITRVSNPAHLIASHCKPWRDSTDEERLDGENGLLLTPTVDHLFDRGFISFEDSGELLVSPVADKTSLRKMGIPVDSPFSAGAFSEGQRQYLQVHREDVFLQWRK